ncbi:MAG: DUF72 domain-containing protein [Candidatus Marinimicrobia bacterium]|nr:DUF72 domain-containing protein [Candidatus Neomarinimicrobiota bacterium]MCF7839867.1 DUF72 domain-containing protein [Candidatus Neomarinimicrobiota bacterium]MCF7902263.1 DUF72 domain-containing protein [Candidatus Neomarinimicrobiota bacterium]
MPDTGELKIGTCSWKYDSWQGLVYSPATKKSQYLKEYSRQFDTVEIDQWFWSLFGADKVVLPDPKIAEDYALSVPDSFRFTIKMPNSLTLTHFYQKQKSHPLEPNPHFLSPDLLQTTLQNLEPLQGKIGALLYQFEYLNKQKMPGQSDFQHQFEKFAQTLPNDLTHAIEIRNPNYLNRRFFDWFRELNLTPVLLHGYYMPDIVETYRKIYPSLEKTVVIRLHGPDRQGIEAESGGDWSSMLRPKDDELETIVKMIQHLRQRQVNVFLNINNHYEGSAPITIKKVRDLLERLPG